MTAVVLQLSLGRATQTVLYRKPFSLLIRMRARALLLGFGALFLRSRVNASRTRKKLKAAARVFL